MRPPEVEPYGTPSRTPQPNPQNITGGLQRRDGEDGTLAEQEPMTPSPAAAQEGVEPEMKASGNEEE